MLIGVEICVDPFDLWAVSLVKSRLRFSVGTPR